MAYDLTFIDKLGRNYEVPKIGVVSIGRYFSRAENWFVSRTRGDIGRIALKNPFESEDVYDWESVSKRHVVLHRYDLEEFILPCKDSDFILNGFGNLLDIRMTKRNFESLFKIFKDEFAKNRVYVNGREVGSDGIFIRDNSKIRLGNYEILFRAILKS